MFLVLLRSPDKVYLLLRLSCLHSVSLRIRRQLNLYFITTRIPHRRRRFLTSQCHIRLSMCRNRCSCSLQTFARI